MSFVGVQTQIAPSSFSQSNMHPVLCVSNTVLSLDSYSNDHYRPRNICIKILAWRMDNHYTKHAPYPTHPNRIMKFPDSLARNQIAAKNQLIGGFTTTYIHNMANDIYFCGHTRLLPIPEAIADPHTTPCRKCVQHMVDRQVSRTKALINELLQGDARSPRTEAVRELTSGGVVGLSVFLSASGFEMKLQRPATGSSEPKPLTDLQIVELLREYIVLIRMLLVQLYD